MMLRAFSLMSLFGAGVLVGRSLKTLEAQDTDEPRPPTPDVRNAGPDEMKSPPKRWDMVDEQADESFPASDPPGNY